MQDNILIKIAGCIIGFVGGLAILCGGLTGYIFTRHAKDNDTQFANNREDHKIIFDKLDGPK